MSCALACSVGDGEIEVRANLSMDGVEALEQDSGGTVGVGIAEERELCAQPMLGLAAGQCSPERELLSPQGCRDIQADLVEHTVRVASSEPTRMLREGVQEG